MMGTNGLEAVFMATGNGNQLREEATTTGRSDDQDGIANGGVAKQQLTKIMVLVMIARGGGMSTKGG
jgi:hypothetical protein